jgi:ribosomal protein S18 acetylase RimI-like enzyme
VDGDPDLLGGARAGERWVLRTRLADGSATDIVGWIDEVGPDTVRVWLNHVTVTSVDRTAVIVARRAPAARGGGDPLRIGAEELERHALPGWLAESEPLGDWTLRAAGGFTGRANSCLAVGDPGRPAADAATAIQAWSARHGIEPRAQVIVDSEPDLALSALGWRETYLATDVMVARLGAFLGADLPARHVRVTEVFELDWLAAYQHSRPNDADPRILEMILAGNPPRAFASIGEPEYHGIARGHVSGPWLGLASIWVTPQQRGRGLATAMMRSLGHWAARRGARYVYLQVAAANSAAVAAYERLGFRYHHTYRYLCPRDPVTHT